MNAFFKFMLRGSAVGALALVAAATGCSDDNKDDNSGAAGDSGSKAGSSNQAGSSSNQAGAGDGGDPGTPGGASSGGAAAGGAAAGGAGAGGAPEATGGTAEAAGGQGGADSGIAVAKFCNSLTFGTEQDPQDTTMILEVGEGAEKVTFTATTGECVPADGAACTPIPTGAAVLVQMFDADEPETALDSSPVAIAGGEQYFFYTDLDDNGPIWQGSKIKQDVATCEEFTYADVP